MSDRDLGFSFGSISREEVVMRMACSVVGGSSFIEIKNCEVIEVVGLSETSRRVACEVLVGFKFCVCLAATRELSELRLIILPAGGGFKDCVSM